MKTYTILENGRMVVKQTILKPLDKYLTLDKGMNQTVDGDIQPVDYNLTWGSFDYTSGVRYVPENIQGSVQSPSNGISFGTSGAKEFTMNIYDTENEGVFSGKKTSMRSSIGLIHGGEFYLVNGAKYGPDSERTTTIQKFVDTGRLTSFGYNGAAGKVDGKLFFNNKNYVIFNKNSRYAQLREFNGLLTNTMNLALTGDGVFHVYKNALYHMNRTANTYYSYSNTLVPTERGKIIGSVLPEKIITIDDNTLMALCLYKEDYESVYRLGFSRATSALEFQGYAMASFPTAIGSGSVRYIDIERCSNYVFTVEFEPTAPDKGIRLSRYTIGALDQAPTYQFIDTKFSLQSKLVSVGNRIYLIANPTAMTQKSVEIFYSDDFGVTWNKIKVNNFTFNANEVNFNSITTDGTTTYIVGNTTTNYSGINKQVIIRG